MYMCIPVVVIHIIPVFTCAEMISNCFCQLLWIHTIILYRYMYTCITLRLVLIAGI